MKTKLVLFDFDGTLADTLPISFSAFRAVFKTHDGIDYQDEDIVAMFGPIEDIVIRENLKNTDMVETAIEEYYTLYHQGHNQSFDCLDEIKEVLNDLKQKGITLAIVTGKSKRGLELSLRELDLDSYFDIKIAGDEVNNPKPDPEGILLALSKASVTADEAIMIGDSNADIQAGLAAHVKTVAAQWFDTVQTSSFDDDPAHFCQTVSDLNAIIN